MKYGIALSGGGIRGAAHVGVLLALEECGLLPSSIAGTSAGGIAAGLYASGMSPGKMKEVVLRLAKKGSTLFDPDLTGILSLVPDLLLHHGSGASGLIKGNRMERYLRDLTGSMGMADCFLRTVIPCVDLRTGNTIACTNSLAGVQSIRHVRWLRDIRLCEAMRATSAVPAVFKPKQLNGMCLVDGGITDVLPVDLLIAAGEKRVLAVDLSEDYKIPKNINLIEVASHSLSIMEMRLRDCTTRGEHLLLRPDLPETDGLLAVNQMPECMEAGYNAARLAIPEIRRLFG